MNASYYVNTSPSYVLGEIEGILEALDRYNQEAKPFFPKAFKELYEGIKPYADLCIKLVNKDKIDESTIEPKLWEDITSTVKISEEFIRFSSYYEIADHVKVFSKPFDTKLTIPVDTLINKKEAWIDGIDLEKSLENAVEMIRALITEDFQEEDDLAIRMLKYEIQVSHDTSTKYVEADGDIPDEICTEIVEATERAAESLQKDLASWIVDRANFDWWRKEELVWPGETIETQKGGFSFVSELEYDSTFDQIGYDECLTPSQKKAMNDGHWAYLDLITTMFDEEGNEIDSLILGGVSNTKQYVLETIQDQIEEMLSMVNKEIENG
jgi:hypothetical protein